MRASTIGGIPTHQAGGVDCADAGSNSSAGYLLRMNADGSFDTGFATGGVATLAFDVAVQPRDGPLIQSDGRIVVAVDAYNQSTMTGSQFLVRYWN